MIQPPIKPPLASNVSSDRVVSVLSHRLFGCPALGLLALDSNYDWVPEVFKIVFSWIILMPIAVIVSGKLLAQLLKLPVASRQILRIPLGVLDMSAKDDEVILGFTGFFLTLVMVAIVGGQPAYEFFRAHFGIDPGHFNSLCCLSSFTTVVWSFILFLIFRVFGRVRGATEELVAQKHEEQIVELAKGGKP